MEAGDGTQNSGEMMSLHDILPTFDYSLTTVAHSRCHGTCSDKNCLLAVATTTTLTPVNGMTPGAQVPFSLQYVNDCDDHISTNDDGYDKMTTTTTTRVTDDVPNAAPVCHLTLVLLTTSMMRVTSVAQVSRRTTASGRRPAPAMMMMAWITVSTRGPTSALGKGGQQQSRWSWDSSQMTQFYAELPMQSDG
ncbi:hypothetical protein BJV78DRAFT_1282397 [Lactifluus subvellereus]|nr:hypothetical protein BJV78DRAFT_1282397 [Lactifluus subvellereus]